MPSYNFVDADGNVFTETMRYSEIEGYLADHPEVTRGIDTPGLIRQNLIGVKGVNTKPDRGFREEILGKVKAAHPLGNVNTF